MEREQKFCQSCGMPLADNNDFGTNADGSLNEKYCKYCFVDGKFVQQCTMDEMIEHCAQFVEEFNKDSEHKVTRWSDRPQLLCPEVHSYRRPFLQRLLSPQLRY